MTSQIKRFRVKFTIDESELDNATISEAIIQEVLQKEMRGIRYSFVEVWETDEKWIPLW